jgi:glycerol-3-phosphate dehydrogenase
MRSRAKELQELAEKSFDICVIGGGATGAGCALDSQLRGLRTVMLEASDVAGATSSAAARPLLQGEVVHTVRGELAATIEDVLARLLGLQFYSWRAAIHAAPVVANLMAQELHWSTGQTKAALATYTHKLNRLLEHAGLELETFSGAGAGQASAV